MSVEDPIPCDNCGYAKDNGTGLWCEVYGHQKDYYDHCDKCQCIVCQGKDEDDY